jgi:hypothetical protein
MVALSRLQEAGRRVVLLSLADEAPSLDLGHIVTYHVPSGVAALNNNDSVVGMEVIDGHTLGGFERRSGNE